jgi:hypothetical protein
MAMSVEAKIAEALFAHLTALPDSPRVAWPNQSFNPPPAAEADDPRLAPIARMYLRVDHLPNRTTQAALGDEGQNRHVGLLQVGVMVRSNTGAMQATEMAGQVIAHFRRGVRLYHEGVVVRVNQPPYAAGALQLPNGWSMTPVTIPYLADAENQGC